MPIHLLPNAPPEAQADDGTVRHKSGVPSGAKRRIMSAQSAARSGSASGAGRGRC